MIDKNFYLENLSAFDILIADDRKQAEAVIFRVFSMLQRDKIWLRDVATEEEIFEEDAELLEEVEEELKELDLKYKFRFDEFYNLVQQEMKKLQSMSAVDPTEENAANEAELDEKENLDLIDEDDLFDDEDMYDEDDEEDIYEADDVDDDDDEDDEDQDAFSHLSDEELALIEQFILSSAKKRFNYTELIAEFPDGDEELIDGEFLLPLIAGKAYGDSDTEIAGKMHPTFILMGYEIEMDDLIKMIAQKSKLLGAEILAFKIAADSLQQGAHPRDIVQQLAQLLAV